MASQGIRLRLVIRRHAVPELRLVWPCALSDDLTIAKLLAQVNEVIPLEGAEWGLEDYAVELLDQNGGGFECLHFQMVNKVFKEDDQVLYAASFPLRIAFSDWDRIRSLLTEDLRRRRLSGRHQISLDGRHLVDGLPFGRPWLRPPRDRPTLDLPPRKRARLTYNEEEDDDFEDGADEYMDESSDEQLLLEGPEEAEKDPSSVGIQTLFENADQDSDSENEDDNVDELAGIEGDDSSSEDEDEEAADLEDELRLLQEDNAAIGESPAANQASPSHPSELPEPLKNLLTPKDLDLTALDQITALRCAFPLTPIFAIHSELHRHGKDMRQTFQALAKSNEPIMSFDAMMDQALTGHGLLHSPGLLEETSLLSGLDHGSPSPLRAPARPLIEVIEEVAIEDAAVQEASEEEVVAEPLRAPQPPHVHFEAEVDEASSSESSDSSSESDPESSFEDGLAKGDASSSEDSDSDGSESGSESDSDSESDSPSAGRGPDLDKPADDSDDSDFGDGSQESSSDSSSSDDSDSDSEPEVLPSKFKAPSQPVRSQRLEAERKQKALSELTKPAQSTTENLSAPTTVEPEAAPGRGLSRTQKRNARRREAKHLRENKALSVSRSESRQLTSHSGSPMAAVGDEESEFQARKRALLSVVSDEAPDNEQQEVNMTRPLIQEVFEEVQSKEEAPVVKAAKTVESSHDAQPSDPKPQRRSKVDMGAGRRLLFGALGLKNPKSKTDEDKLRKDLMKNIKPLENHRTQDLATKDAEDANPVESEEDPDAWREKIVYRAVECCHEGIVLSEPPFPFVQRWDPQQQYGAMRKRKRASQDYYDDSYYDDSYYDESYAEDAQYYEDAAEWEDTSQTRSKKKSKKGKAKETSNDDVELNYDDIPAKVDQDVDQLMVDDDLPILPTDLSTLPTLKLGDVQVGMVITWKQLLMSKATRWQPQSVSLTGRLLSISDSDILHLVLARRDREQNDKVYDDNGKRIYDKFETLDSDDDEGEDDGRREVGWTDLVEPRVVQQAPPGSEGGMQPKAAQLDENGVSRSSSADKVSKPNDNDEIDKDLAEELGSQEVRAEVSGKQGDLVSDKPSGSTNSTSIPSGQGAALIGPLGSNEAALEAAQSDVIRSTNTSDDKVGSDGQPQVTAVQEEVPETPDVAHDDGEAMDLDLDNSSSPHVEDPILNSVIPDSMPVINLPPEQSDMVPLLPSLSSAGEPRPASVTSIDSGRQPQSKYDIRGSHGDRIEAAVSAASSKGKQVEESELSSSPFPTVEEIIQTAASSVQTQPSQKPAQKSAESAKAKREPDLEYEEAMRKLDDGDDDGDDEGAAEGDDSDTSRGKNKSIRSLFPNATQPDTSNDLPKLLLTPQKPTRFKRGLRTSPFVIPEGSQVVTIDSSPRSVQYTENYAENSKDASHRENSPAPSSLRLKKQSVLNQRGTRSRGKKETEPGPRRRPRSSMPAFTKATSTKATSTKARASMSAVSQTKKRGKRGGKL